MAWLLDTSVLTELRKGRQADAKVRRWAASTLRGRHFISVLSLGEIRQGIERLRTPSPDLCSAFEDWLAQLQAAYADDILPVSEEITDLWGLIMAVQPLPVTTGLIAATALVHDLTVVTREAGVFKRTGVKVVNPFE